LFCSFHNNPCLHVRDSEKREAPEAVDGHSSKKPKTADAVADGEVEANGDAALRSQVASSEADVSQAAAVKTPSKKKKDNAGFNEHPFTFIPPDDPNLLACM
jgi:hypothetical protein